jgi:alpha-glucosidase
MITYQIYPRSFQDSNGDGIGDLNGILSRLEYVKRLGVEAVWISPFFQSPMRDFGYDVSDYRSVDPSFGTMADFRRLLGHANALDLKILLDLVFSHTSEEHPWFRDSVARNAGRSDWYLWADAKPDGNPPNNWLSVFGGSAWQWHAERRQYYYHSFLPSQPDLNLHVPAVQAQLTSEMQFWLDAGVSGFRFDACNHYFQDLALRDNPPRSDTGNALHPYGFQVHEFDQGRPEALPFMEMIRRLLDEYGAFSLAEVGGNDAISLMGEYTAPGRLHSAYSFSLMGANGSAAHVARVIERLQSTIKPPALPCYAFSNHDKSRVATRWLHGRNPQSTAKQMLALLVSMPGHICLYQGEELGLPQADVPFERLQDPYGKNFWPKFKGRDGCRTPMPWSKADYGGFSTLEPWLPMPECHRVLNVEAQEQDPESSLNTARMLLRLRKEYPGLRDGTLTSMEHADDVLTVTRQAGEQTIRCSYNLGHVRRTLRTAGPSTVIFAQHTEPTGSDWTLAVNGVLWETIAEANR